MIRMGRAFTALIAALLIAPAAWSQVNSANMVLTRSVEGFYDAGATLHITIVATKDTTQLLAFALRETLPEGVEFKEVESATFGQTPSIRPAPGDGGELQFAWINVPAFPFTMTYSVEVTGEVQESVDLTGQIEYRTTGGREFSEVTTTTLDGPPPVPLNTAEALLTRAVSGAYEANALLEVTLNVTKNEIAVNEVSLKESLPEGWTYDGVVAQPGTVVADTLPAVGSGGEIAFGWNAPPDFPLSIAYRIRVGNDASSAVSLSGAMEYRTTGRVERSNVVTTALEPAKMGFCGCAPAGGAAGGGDLLLVALVLVSLFAARARLDACSRT
ncbi:MAG: hypothetical protein GC168_00770 [Candidatus Hydrogenedens sp.]|nr:hypothetical protein [Candidatus Hydrogenedens sp.]